MTQHNFFFSSSLCVRAWSVAFLCAVFALTGCDIKERHKLAIKFREGDSLRLSLESQASVAQDLLGIQQNTSTSIQENLLLVVEKVDGNFAWVKVTLESAALDAKAPGYNLSFDTASGVEPPSPEAAALAAMIGRSYRLQLTPAGRVVQTKGLDELKAEAWAAAHPEPEEEAGASSTPSPVALPGAPDRGGLARLLLEGTRRRDALERALASYPVKPVALEEQWTSVFSSEEVAPLSITRVYELKKLDGGKAIVDFTSKLSPSLGKPLTEVGGVALGAKLSGEGRGFAEIDETSGWLIKAQSSETAQGNARFGLLEADVEGASVSWPIEIALESTLNVTERGTLDAESLAAMHAERDEALAVTSRVAPPPGRDLSELTQSKPVTGIDAAFERCVAQLRPLVDAVEERADEAIKPALAMGAAPLAGLASREALERRLELSRQAQAASVQAVEELQALPNEFAEFLRDQRHPPEWNRVFTSRLGKAFNLNMRIQLRELEGAAARSMTSVLQAMGTPNRTQQTMNQMVATLWDLAEKMRQRRELREMLELD